MKTEKIIRDALENNPELKLVLEIAARSRAVEAMELPRNMGTATETVSIPVNSACLVSPEMPPACLIQIALL
jgi:hypothetical protein